MEKISLTVFKKDCMGCHACEVACKQEHSLGIGPRFIRVLEDSPFFTPVYCHHCANAPCRESCPVRAIYRDERGIVCIDSETCIGCRECVTACPFAAMQFDDVGEKAAKCDLCRERLQVGGGAFLHPSYCRRAGCPCHGCFARAAKGRSANFRHPAACKDRFQGLGNTGAS